MGRAIHNEWFTKLPRRVKAALIAANLYNLPRLFTIWWLSRSDRQPNDFILPPIFAQFPDYSIESIHNEDDDLTPRLFDDNGETKLGGVVMRAWNFIPSVDRSLMVYCWAARHQEKAVHDKLAHLSTSAAEAKAVLKKDMSGELQGLCTRALVIVDNSKAFVK
ncbi:hypothetical protein PILCRDRAFT_821632 [Piloderma croceum F 1598]|uniref:Uncharacterized protein n=1 Tax=Piloderma croceum (strain F 1598) TaxID=765440 RepID=A0A0C3FPS7_PILCF|nr:hypothetical protein PILCRDRAFT_821632 [Piloderma croceum F 1598]